MTYLFRMTARVYKKLRRQRPELNLPAIRFLTKDARRLVSRHSPTTLVSERVALILVGFDDDPWNAIHRAPVEFMIIDQAPVFDKMILEDLKPMNAWITHSKNNFRKPLTRSGKKRK